MAKIDDSVKKKVPELRFKGFTDEWEERKFADFIDVKSGKDYKHLNSGSIPVYGTGGYMLSVDRALSDIDAIGIGRKGTIDKPYLLKAPFWTVDTLFYAVPKQNIDLQFSLSIFKKINWKKFDESTGVPSLSKTVINSVSVSVPSYEEQQKIGSFFKQLDDTIALHQHKLDLLKEQKKGYLQKMFPKNGEKVPELRFAGFADDWELRKLTDITSSYSGLTYSPTDIQDTGTFVLRSSNVKNDQLIDADNVYVNPDIVNSINVKVGDVIIVVRNGSRTLIGKHAIVNEEMPNTVIGAFMSAFRGENGNYVNALLSTENFQKEVHKSLGATINQITGKDFSMMIFPTPKFEEQQKIGTFFKQLDDTIALHQRKLDLLKEQKKGFLQKMFV
ncbi:restriction endonuclease subunit S [Lactococcus lactis]|nr:MULTISPECIES: restriction endonuclease subunit S [Lactobacillales]MDT2580366.1 restriction endonuclease subunit S [Enterococcus raffinosus]MDT2890799.1 restriction endonuclease subunit S [Lactococcus lactis]MDT2914840.1 restriction endonuclease subunit S [Lactococcus lactis]